MFLNNTSKVGLIKSEIYTKYIEWAQLVELQKITPLKQSSCWRKITINSLLLALLFTFFFIRALLGALLGGGFGFVGFVLLISWSLLWLVQGALVSDSNAHEVHVEGDKNGGNEDGEEDVLLLGLLVVTSLWGSVGDGVGLEESKEVNGVPDGNKDVGDDGEDLRDVESRSGVIGIVREEEDEESAGNDQRHAEDQGDQNVPPVDVLNKEHVEDLNEEEQSHGEGEGSNSDKTALDWEASAAGKILGLLG